MEWLAWVKVLRWQIGADCWYWAPDGERWRPAVFLGAGQVDGYPVFGVFDAQAEGERSRRCWLWQLSVGGPAPRERPPALDGAAGPWPVLRVKSQVQSQLEIQAWPCVSD